MNNTGPFYLILIVSILTSNLLLQMKIRKLQVVTEVTNNLKERNHPIRIWIAVPSIMALILVGFWIVAKNNDNVAKTIFVTLLFYLVQNLVIPLYYILRTPKLKEFTLKQWSVFQLFKNEVSPVIENPNLSRREENIRIESQQ